MAGINITDTDELYQKLAQSKRGKVWKACNRAESLDRSGQSTSKNCDVHSNEKFYMKKIGVDKGKNNYVTSNVELSSERVSNDQRKQSNRVHGNEKRQKYTANRDASTFTNYYPNEHRRRSQSLNRTHYRNFEIAGSKTECSNRAGARKLPESAHYKNIRSSACLDKSANFQSGRLMGYKRLQHLTGQSPTDIISALVKSDSGFENLLNTELRPDLLFLVVKILAVACKCEFPYHKAALLNLSCQTKLLCSIEKYLFRMPTDDSSERRKAMASFFSELLVYFEAVMNTVPNTASEKFKNLFINTNISLNAVECHQKVDLSEQREEFNKLNKQLQNMLEEWKVKESLPCRKVNYPQPPNDFRELNIFPTKVDLLSKEIPFLRKNIIHGAYENVEHYLDVQFRLLREDFLAPLREGLEKLFEVSEDAKRRHKFNNIKMYQNIKFGKSKIVNDTIGIIVQFDRQNKMKVKWEYSKRLMFGAFLLFTNDNFQNMIFGTVLNRDIEDLKKGEVIVTILEQNNSINIFESEFLMIESEIYFEPYKHVMVALQTLSENSFPMKKYVINVENSSKPPSYLCQNNLNYDLDLNHVNVLDEMSWPNEEALGLDKSQLHAFKAALTQEFVVIQGPPGTGKTYLGLKIAKVLLQNKTAWYDDKNPILVICYTNHALDQFLEGLLTVTDRIIRVGGQSKNPALTEYNLRNKRKSFIYDEKYSLLNDLHFTVSTLMQEIKCMAAGLEELERKKGIVSWNLLKKNDIICAVQCYSFGEEGHQEDQILVDWLLEGFDETCSGTYFLRETQSVDENVVAEEEEEEGDLEEEERRLTMDRDPILFNFDDVKHDISYAVNFCVNEEEINELSLHLYNKKTQHSEEIKARIDYLEQVLCYWKNCLGKNQGEPSHLQKLHRVKNLWKLSITDRWLLYNDWLNSLKISLSNKIRDTEKKYCLHVARYQEMKNICDLEVMSNSLIVGMTTTNAARLRNSLNVLNPKIVIVEEAAEVLESQIVVSLNEKCEHVILIGDHKQLKPSPAVFRLARKYNFDISLFERMVRNGMQCHSLERQHRMRPEISKLIAPTIYPDLCNDLSVYNFAKVRGITKSLFFLSHNEREEEMDDSMSHKNCHEADFMLALCRHLILQGYNPKEITILATYKGQMFLMKQKQKNQLILSGVHITVVDNYQGEENKIILLSLVRSNKEAKIGFLSIENRVCVALSRAKEGLFVMGNMENLEQSSEIWPKIKATLLEQESFGTQLILQCEVHPYQQIKVNCASDFKNAPEGGCSLLCEAQLDCGHLCQSICHVRNREHKNYKCYKKCERIPLECELQHMCPKLCYEDCGKCKTVVQRDLHCGHVIKLPCYVDINEYKCQVIEEIELPNCDHKVEKPCFRDAATYPCPLPCPDRLPCGHSCTLSCHVLVDPDHLEYKCKKRCARINAGCTESHNCVMLCYEECGQCMVEVEKQLPNCNHFQRMKCSEDPATSQCLKKCQKTMSCGHFCRKLCYEVCGNCQVMVRKPIPSCGHFAKMKCCEQPSGSHCREPCQRYLSCGHTCAARCDQKCTLKCQELVQYSVAALCGHNIKIPCYLQKDASQNSELLLQFCTEPCGKKLLCGHICKGTCGKCMQGRIHIACAEKCNRNLICGHQCRVPCASFCPPCSAKCQYKCKHSRCSKNCGVPCAPCEELCEWKCEHLQCRKKCHEQCDRGPCYEPCKKKLKCGHECIGFCGDICPPLCRFCNKEEVTTIFFGKEDDENARFVFLVDCKHSFESEGLETWLKTNSDGKDDEIGLKTCPQCKTPIMKTERFMKYVKLTFRDIARVKTKIFGDQRILNKERINLQDNLARQSGALKIIMKRRSKLYDIILQTSEDSLKQVNNSRRKFLSQNDLHSLRSQIEIFHDLVLSISQNIIKPNITLKREIEEKLFQKFDLILEKLKQRWGKFSTQETQDFNRECKRFLRATQLAVIESTPNFVYALTNKETKILYERGYSLVHSITIFSDQEYEELKNIVNLLHKSVKILPLSDYERKEIVKAMGLAQGHWYKCPNGHIYCITECGGAMEIKKCPECKEDIGGTGHRLLRSNALAPEMDGATRHAWPGGLY